jgi:hypothetical protein
MCAHTHIKQYGFSLSTRGTLLSLFIPAETAVLAYFFGPIGVLVLCNIILFVITAFKIINLKRETRMLKGEESKRHDDEANRQR